MLNIVNAGNLLADCVMQTKLFTWLPVDLIVLSNQLLTNWASHLIICSPTNCISTLMVGFYLHYPLQCISLIVSMTLNTMCTVCCEPLGKYAGFDVNQPTSRTGGKGEAINLIRRSLGQNVSVTMIGDGATDLEASPPANNFIGYGGNVVRDEVRNRAQYYVTDFQQLYKDLWSGWHSWRIVQF